ncbi:MAG: YggT family protein [Pseudomonadota bacterium]
MTALKYLISAIAQLLTIVFLLRLLLPLFRADTRNPVTQGIYGLTAPVVTPLRRVIPSIGRIDTATVLILIAIQMASTALIYWLSGIDFGFVALLIHSILDLLSFTVGMLWVILIIRVLLSWFAPNTYHPLIELGYTLTEPLMRPFRRLLPPMGGLDISIIFVFIALTFCWYLIGDIRVFLWQSGFSSPGG